MKRFFCGRCNAPIRKWNPVCYSCGYVNSHLVRKLKTARFLKILLTTVFTVGGTLLCCLVLNANLLFPWQRGARRNKRVILDYAAENYPGAEIVDHEFNSAKLFVWNNFMDCIVFEWDNIEFGITAEGGKIIVDGYCGARAIAQFDKIIQDEFLKPRGITAYTSYIFADNYYEIYPYTGRLDIQITIRDQGSTPQEVEWLYDFYKYWKKAGEFLTKYSVCIDIVLNGETVYHINYNYTTEFSNKTAFYAAFKPGPMM